MFTDGDLNLEVQIDSKQETVWLTQTQISELFQRDRTVIVRHINNIFKKGELDKDSVCANIAHTASDGKTYFVVYFNLDVIISVGYRVKSKRGIAFRRWANSVLKDYLIKGYASNEKRLEALPP